jgi:hypothetical protein
VIPAEKTRKATANKYGVSSSDNIVELSELEEGRAETTVAVADPSTAEIRGVEENTS